MNSMLKKFISIAMALCLILLLMPTTMADTDTLYIGEVTLDLNYCNGGGDTETVEITLDSTEQEIYDMIVYAARNSIITIDLENFELTIAEAQSIIFQCFQIISYTEWDLINLDLTTFSYGASGGDDDDYVYYINLNFNFDEDEYAACLEYVNKEIDRAIADALLAQTDMQAALLIHDYICTHFAYNTDMYDGWNVDHDIYNFIVDRVGVCESYAKFMAACLDKLGIENMFAHSDNEVHIWNLVKINDKWYHFDCTWDDPIPDLYGRAEHKYCGVSSTKLYSNDGSTYDRTDWLAVGLGTKVTTGTAYDSTPFWLDLSQTPIYYNNSWYYLEFNSNTTDSTLPFYTSLKKITGGADSKLIKSNATVVSAGKKISNSILWSSNTVGNRIYYSYDRTIYAGLFKVDNVLYYNSLDTIYSYNLSTLKAITSYNFPKLVDAEFTIMGMCYDEEGTVWTYAEDDEYGYNIDIDISEISKYTFTNWITTTTAGCANIGIAQRTYNSAQNVMYSYTPPTFHNYSGWYTYSHLDCLTDEVEACTCSKCYNIKYNLIEEATGHDWENDNGYICCQNEDCPIGIMPCSEVTVSIVQYILSNDYDPLYDSNDDGEIDVIDLVITKRTYS